jgi:branched-subunit amino acid aminotransferase/4-amino-4-deoxychorismate lyase
MVTTYEIRDGALEWIGRHETLAAASAALPPGSYSTLRTYPGPRVLRLAEHVRRLTESLPQPAPLDVARVRSGLAQALALENTPESRVRLTFAPPQLFASLEPFVPLPASDRQNGVRCVTVDVRRTDPRAKRTGFLATAIAAYASLPSDANEGLMVGEDGVILEGLTSNFFSVVAGRLRTEHARVLPGITRRLVLELAEGLLPIEPAGVRKEELAAASECFLTSVSRDVLPVVRVDAVVIGDGKPGPITRELQRRLAERVLREGELLSVGPS